MKNIVYFDLETKKSFDEVGGRNKLRYLGVSVGVTYSTERGAYEVYGENRVNDLIDELRRADLVVGYNIIGFDFPVLQGENEFFDFEQVPSLDMMVDIQAAVETRPPTTVRSSIPASTTTTISRSRIVPLAAPPSRLRIEAWSAPSSSSLS